MVMVVGNSRLRIQSKKINAGTYPLTALALKTGERAEKIVDIFKPRHGIGIEREMFTPSMNFGFAYLSHRGFIPRVQTPPGVLVLFAVKFIGLLDIDLTIRNRLFNER